MATSGPGRHDAHFYEDALSLAQRVAQHLGDALVAGGGAIALARAEHLAMFDRILTDQGVPLADHRARGRYIPIDADVLCRQLVPGMLPDVGAFRTTVGGLIDDLASSIGDAPLHVYGELVDMLWAVGKVDAVIRLEQLWTELGRERGFDLLCGYRLGGFAAGEDTPAFETICAHHTNPSGERTLLALAQRAQALEVEMVRRAQLEDQLQRLLELAGDLAGAASCMAIEQLRDRGRDELAAPALREILSRHCALATERVRVLERERRARAEAEDATRAREEILSVVSHDLRNPLGTIMIGVSTLRRADSDRVRTTASRIQHQTLRMARLLDDLVDFAGIQAGRLTLSRAPHAPADIVTAVSELFGPVAHERGLVFAAAAARDLPPVECDSERALQVMANLITNAIKVTPSGGSIEVGATPDDQRVVFFVRDTGPGIDPIDLPRVFERGAAAPYTGTGLGLSIARGIVDAHGGRIWAESRVGVGSTFYFSLSRNCV
jgi:signal transduction histidine kinase